MGNYDLIQVPVSGQPISAAEFGIRVRDAIVNLDARVTPLEVQQQRVIKRGRRTTTSSVATTTEIAVLRVDNIPIINGGLYRIATSSLNMDTSAPNDISRAVIRVATGVFGTTATIASTQISYIRNTIDDITNSNVIPQQTFYVSTADTYMSMLLSVQRVAGTGNIIMFASGTEVLDFTVEYAGPDPGDTGVVL